MKPLPFIDGAPTPEAALVRLQRETAWLRAQERGFRWDPWWLVAAGVGVLDEGLVLDEPALPAHCGATPLISAMGLTGIPWSCSYDEMCVVVAKWAVAAVEHIVGLERDLAEARGTIDRQRGELHGWKAQAVAAEARTAAARAELESERQAHADALQALRRAVADAEAARDAARAGEALAQTQAEAWRASAAAAQASADAARGSLDIMARALHLSTPVEEPGLVVRSVVSG